MSDDTFFSGEKSLYLMKVLPVKHVHVGMFEIKNNSFFHVYIRYRVFC